MAPDLSAGNLPLAAFLVAIKEENRFILYLLVKNKTNANFFEVVVLLI